MEEQLYHVSSLMKPTMEEQLHHASTLKPTMGEQLYHASALMMEGYLIAVSAFEDGEEMLCKSPAYQISGTGAFSGGFYVNDEPQEKEILRCPEVWHIIPVIRDGETSLETILSKLSHKHQFASLDDAVMCDDVTWAYKVFQRDNSGRESHTVPTVSGEYPVARGEYPAWHFDSKKDMRTKLRAASIFEEGDETLEDKLERLYTLGFKDGKAAESEESLL